MLDFKGKPGPWEIVNGGDIFGPLGGDSGDGAVCDERDGWQVAEVGRYSSFVDGELVEQGADVRKANLALLLAAKELLEALRIARDYVAADLEHRKQAFAGYPQKWETEERDLAAIDAAIAKALNTDTTER